MSKRIRQRITAALLAAVMVFTATPVSVSAAEDVTDIMSETAVESAEEQMTDTEEEISEEQAAAAEEKNVETENVFEIEQTHQQTVDEATTEDGTDLSENNENPVKMESDMESTAAEESMEDLVDESEAEMEAEEETTVGELTLTATMTSSEYDKKLHEINANIFPDGYIWDERYSRGAECFGYAHWVANYIFGLTEGGANDSINWGRVYDINSVKAGDIVQYGNTSGQGHTIFVTAVSGNTIIYTDANSDYKNTVKWGQTITKNAKLYGYSFSYVKSNPCSVVADTPSNNTPIGDLNSVTGGAGSITVRGWAFDPNVPNKALTIHVYIGGPAGSGAPCYIIYADKQRTDVENVYPGMGNYHGFEETIATDKTGTQDVYVYALNEGAGNDNPQIGKRTVTITADRKKGVYMNTGYAQTIPNGYYHIASSLGDNWWLTIADMSNDNYANVQLWDYSIRDFDCDEQLFYFKFIDQGGRGFYTITNKKSGKCITVVDASQYMYDENGNPTNVWQYEDNGNSGQQWAIKAIDGGSKGTLYTLQARCSGYCLDLWEAKTENRANISMCTENGSPAQQWRLVPYESPKLQPPTATLANTAAVEAGTKFYLNKNGADDVYYTWNGTTPTKQSAKYSDSTGLTIPTGQTVTLKAVGVKEGYRDSDILEITYTIKQTVPDEPEKPSEGSSDIESSPTPEDEDPQDGVKWHYDEQKVTYKDLSQHGRIVTNIKAKTYDGTPYKPAVKVTATENGKTVTLSEGTDYRVLYFNNTHAGTGSVIVRGNGVYRGSVSKEFTITKKPCKKLKVLADSMFVGDTSEPEVYVYDGSTLLKKDRDYTLEENVGLTASKGKKKVYITAGKDSDYEGFTAVTITVYEQGSNQNKRVIDSTAKVTLSQTVYQYSATACKPAAAVEVNGQMLTAGKDYTIKYQNNKEAGTAYAVITGKGDYVGSIVKAFTIKTASNEFALKKPIAAVTYNGKLQKPKAVITVNGKTLKQNKDYTITYNNNLHATDKAKVTVRGKGSYAGMAANVFYFQINPCPIKKASVKVTKQGALSVTYAKHTLVEGADYTVTYSEADSRGRRIVTIKAVEGGSFTGEITKKIKMS